MTNSGPREHGGGIDAAAAVHGGVRADWLDLSTGINPVPYPVGAVAAEAWARLPDRTAVAALEAEARRFWSVPEGVGVLAAPGASALIGRLPALAPTGRVAIPAPSYNEHAAAFGAAGWQVADRPPESGAAAVLVNPNNPDGRRWRNTDLPVDVPLVVVDESFCDTAPEASLIDAAARPRVLVLKSFGKFWGLAGLRLGFAIGDPALVAALAEALGPWPVSGPALEIGARALSDAGWAATSRARLARDAGRLDSVVTARGGRLVGGTTLFRLYEVGDAAALQARLARGRVWSRVFGYAPGWLRLGLPPPERWEQLEAAL